MLPYKHRLGKNYLKKTYSEGKKFRGEFGMLVVRKVDSGPVKFAYVVSKKTGNAVQRHHLTRLLREITREVIKEYNFGYLPYHCQYVAFKYCKDYNEIKNEYSKQIKDAFGYTKDSGITTN